MKYDTFRKAERIRREIRDFKDLIGIGDPMIRSKHIQAAEDDEEIRKVIEEKIKRLLEEFDSL
jgi:hypothetical protein